MSYTNLVFFRDGKAVSGEERRNAWGGSAAIWIYLAKVRLGLGDDCYRTEAWEDVWALITDATQPESERIVNAFCCDGALVYRREFPRLVAAFREVGEKIKGEFPKFRNHFPAWADEIEANDEAEAVGLHGTSVTSDPWMMDVPCDACGCTCGGNNRPYDLNRDVGHWNVFNRLVLAEVLQGSGDE